MEITAKYPAGVIGTTEENLKEAAMGEYEEYTDLYPEFARIAAEEGFPKVSAAFKMIAVAEKVHEQRFLKFLANLQTGKVFESEDTELWLCRNCGYVHEGKKAPKICPACEHPQAYFEKQAKNY
ncbi:MAG: hypothetical protein CSB03_00115 [Bacteroidia bacterium]|nr:MAG: hypothetical protein CSB03_00115 [Bacteroidia bacterium]